VLRVWPNPSSGQFQLQATPGTYELVVLDITGRQLQRALVRFEAGVSQVLDLPRGAYLLSLEGNGGYHAPVKVVVH
ncbi:MAG: T9SS type A sorting domain-containing protein, partial [Flavobacteriales bacterium]|nr:T9SS type A sorting domain-containing protein [Flavobacteriales bacterium]